MKKSILSAFLGLVLLSCTATKGMLNEEKTLLNTYPIRKANEIDRLYVKDKLDLRNKEINLYHIKDLKVEGIPKVNLDINYEKGLIDSFLIYKVEGDKIILSLNNLGENKTIRKEMIFARVPKDSKLKFKLENEYQVIDNTIFEIKAVETDEYRWFKLVPFFLDEDTFEIKAKENIEKETNIAFYEDNLILEFNNIKTLNNVTYKNTEAKLGKGKSIKGYGQPGSEIMLDFDDFRINTLVNSDGKWSTIIPNSYSGNLKIYQKTIVKGKTIYTEANMNIDRRNGE